MAPRKRKAPKKIAPPKDAKETVIHTDPFHITFPITLIYKEANLTKFCYFQVKFISISIYLVAAKIYKHMFFFLFNFYY